jgi:hypothetical protein
MYTFKFMNLSKYVCAKFIHLDKGTGNQYIKILYEIKRSTKAYRNVLIHTPVRQTENESQTRD